MESKKLFLSVKQMRKSFGPNEVLKGVDLNIERGKITALMGANGAGKSTLVKIISGRLVPDSGVIQITDETYSHVTQKQVRHFGINIIPQELDLIPHLSAEQNILLGIEGFWPWSRKTRKMREKARAVLESLDLKLPRHREVSELSPSQQQLIAVAKALVRDSRLLILDEPTSMLTTHEIEKLFTLLRKLKAEGVALVYISHRMHEIFDVTDEVVVLKDGRVTGRGKTSELSDSKIIEWMVGETVPKLALSQRPTAKRYFDRVGTPALEVRDLTNEYLNGVSLSVYPGEILGVLGLMGSGRTELLRAIAGIDRVEGGEFLIDGKPVRIHSVRDAMKNGVYLAPEDRRGSGLFLQQSVGFNTHLVNLDQFHGPMKFLTSSMEKNCYDQARGLVSLNVCDYRHPAQQLSGGNQQRLILSKILLRNARILLVDEATAGVDVMTKGEIRERLHRLADEGKSVIFVSSEWNEVMAIADRAIVFYEGSIVRELANDSFDERQVLSSIFEFSSNHAQAEGAPQL